MSDTQQPWPGAAFGAPKQPSVETHAPADLSRIMQSAPAKKPVRGYHQFELPDSVKESIYWKGADADRFFGMWEPNAGEVRKLIKADADFAEAAKNFIAALGIPCPDGSVQRDEDGAPQLADVTDNTTQVLPWWERLPTKAQTMITSLLIEFINPTADEGKSLRASRKWVG